MVFFLLKYWTHQDINMGFLTSCFFPLFSFCNLSLVWYEQYDSNLLFLQSTCCLRGRQHIGAFYSRGRSLISYSTEINNLLWPVLLTGSTNMLFGHQVKFNICNLKVEMHFVIKDHKFIYFFSSANALVHMFLNKILLQLQLSFRLVKATEEVQSLKKY